MSRVSDANKFLVWNLDVTNGVTVSNGTQHVPKDIQPDHGLVEFGYETEETYHDAITTYTLLDIIPKSNGNNKAKDKNAG